MGVVCEGLDRLAAQQRGSGRAVEFDDERTGVRGRAWPDAIHRSQNARHRLAGMTVAGAALGPNQASREWLTSRSRYASMRM